MALDHIRNAVLQAARAEGEGIEGEARQLVERQVEKARRAIEDEFARRLDQDRQAAEQAAQRRVIQRRSEHNLEMLRRRNEILDQVFDRASKRLAELPDADYCAVIAGWMRKRIPADAGGVVLCGERDLTRLKAVVDRMNSGRPEGARLKLAPYDQPLTGGVVFRAGQFEVDLSIDAMTVRLREALATEVSGILFSGEMTV